MKTEKKILTAFILNLVFSVFEFFGGAFTHSVAILSDSIHDLGDAMSIGIAYLLEKKSKKQPDKDYTYGYARYSVMGSCITCTILICGSILVSYNAVMRIIHPTVIDYSGMIYFAIFGVVVNFLAAFFTREGDSLNQKSVNLHMLEDVLGWVVVLIGAIVMKFTDIYLIDSIMSIAVAAFIFVGAVKNLKESLDLFLEKRPHDISLEDVKHHLLEISGVTDVHHIHIWSLDGVKNYATLHVVTDEDSWKIKKEIKEELKELNITHATLELEKTTENCDMYCCTVEDSEVLHQHCHHHH